MLGEGIVSFGVAVVTQSLRKLKCVAECRLVQADPLVTLSAAGVKSMSPSGLWKWTTRSSSAFVDPLQLRR